MAGPEHLGMRERAKTKAGASFDLKKYNDSVPSCGSPPPEYAELLGL